MTIFGFFTLISSGAVVDGQGEGRAREDNKKSPPEEWRREQGLERKLLAVARNQTCNLKKTGGAISSPRGE